MDFGKLKDGSSNTLMLGEVVIGKTNGVVGVDTVLEGTARNAIGPVGGQYTPALCLAQRGPNGLLRRPLAARQLWRYGLGQGPTLG